MKTRTVLFVALILVVSALFLPSALAAKERRGANIIVTRLDGSKAQGELIAVKQDSLLLISNGTDLSVALADIKTVRIVKKSRALKFALIGFATGAAEGFFVANADPEDRELKVSIFWAGVIGGAQALIGAGIGLLSGADAVLPFEGERDEVVKRYLDKLKGRSRESRTPGPYGPAEIKPETVQLEAHARPPEQPAPQTPAPPRIPRRPRFRFNLAMTLNPVEGAGAGWYQEREGSWRFPESVPPEEAGPYAWSFRQIVRLGSGDGLVYLGPVSLAYELTEHWLAEVEFVHRGGLWSGVFTGDENGTTMFVSTADGKTYGADIPGPPDWGLRVSFDSLLVGLDYRFLAPGPLAHLSLEVGAGAGPARVRIAPGYGGIPADQKIVLSARFHTAVDYYFTPAISLGGFLGYRFIRADFPSTTGTADVTFHDVTDTWPYVGTLSIVRTIEVTVPERPLSLYGLAYGARVTFRL